MHSRQHKQEVLGAVAAPVATEKQVLELFSTFSVLVLPFRDIGDLAKMVDSVRQL